MERYKDLDGDSGISSYEIRDDSIAIEFKGARKIYVWSYPGAGAANVERMKQLAKEGSGLNGFIQQKVKTLYDR
jgi:hypothetical protein